MSNLVRDCVESFPETFSGAHLHRWIVTYPVDKVIRALNNWGQYFLMSGKINLVRC